MSILTLISDTLVSPAAAGNIEYNGQFYGTDSNSARGQLQRITLNSKIDSTSGTSITYTSIPSWAKKITVMFSGVSTNSTNAIQIQIGSGSIDISGYSGAAGTRGADTFNSTGFLLNRNQTAAVFGYGIATLATLGSNIWVESGTWASSSTDAPQWSAGGKTLSGTLDQLRIIASATGNPSDTFDAGSINIMCEG